MQWAETCCQTIASIIAWTWRILFQSFPRSTSSTTTNDASKTHIQTKQFQNVFVVYMHFQNIKQITLEIHLSWQSWRLQKSEKIKIKKLQQQQPQTYKKYFVDELKCVHVDLHHCNPFKGVCVYGARGNSFLPHKISSSSIFFSSKPYSLLFFYLVLTNVRWTTTGMLTIYFHMVWHEFLKFKV